MFHFTESTCPADVEALKPCADYLMYRVTFGGRPAAQVSFGELARDNPTWCMDSMLRGAEHLASAAEKSQVMHDVYTPEECRDDPAKQDVKLFYLPAEEPSPNRPFVVLIAGGAYTCVCSQVEAFPSARHFNKLGYHVFVLNYRVTGDPLFPKPVDDLAAALRYIWANSKKLGLTSMEYIVSGFSAGANLTAIWGTEKRGYAHYGLPKPRALFPIYPPVTWELMDGPGRDWFLSVMFGKGFSMDTARAYDAAVNFTGTYPPCYIVHAKDDETVPYSHSVRLKELLDMYHIPARLELIEKGGHGWGDGGGTAAEGWPERAALFEQSLT